MVRGPGPTEALAAKVTRLKEKLAKLKEEMAKLAAYEKQMLASPDQQVSLTDPDSRSMATSGRGSGVVGYNVQVAVETENHLIITHEGPMLAPTARSWRMWPTRPRQHWTLRVSMPSPTAVTSAVKRSSRASNPASQSHCPNR